MNNRIQKSIFSFLILITFAFSNCKSTNKEPVITKITAEKYKNLTQNLSKKTIVHYWFSFCEPCIKEIPDLEKIVKENKLDVIHISADKSDSKMQDNLAKVMKKIKMKDCYIVDYDNLYPNGTDSMFIQKDFAYKVGWKEFGSPYYLLLDKNGKTIIASNELTKIKEKL
ncbi:TlpA family protein disulfide reductase [Flavobacterium ponti]|jgi:thiol-disulfide isomerase/thioredoxin|uniref:TlpA family protein disulfide reductase n=1 Tax=Flavobacterium ponti TaxID=665133 RepID=A0ABV9NZ93_9FLAO